jgi:hypothetical protein
VRPVALCFHYTVQYSFVLAWRDKYRLPTGIRCLTDSRNSFASLAVHWKGLLLAFHRVGALGSCPDLGALDGVLHIISHGILGYSAINMLSRWDTIR